ncbi:hypothetical protein [Pelagibius sp. Alg239-R121]|uniref:hypothetical protein n=1 Tax=Pelagibius sp. Alg239-R121 TaxID=2993448 RepID=UPI0024A72AFD|nr:hypothetical protein [Pelagibius sp. Alg239-R121]
MTSAKGLPIADAFHELQHQPDETFTRTSYKQLCGEMYLQYAFATEHLGIKIEPYLESGDPYENSRAMRTDAVTNKHLYFLPTTDQAFGSGTPDMTGNWMTRETDIEVAGYPLLINDVFRAVHDLFGHAIPNTTFGPSGEERAWHCHSRMCTALALPALTTETRGQNCWVNFGPHMRSGAGKLHDDGNPGWLPPSQRPFAVQKNGLLPSWISGIALIQDAHGLIQCREEQRLH